jgi:hypothetical protein
MIASAWASATTRRTVMARDREYRCRPIRAGRRPRAQQRRRIDGVEALPRLVGPAGDGGLIGQGLAPARVRSAGRRGRMRGTSRVRPPRGHRRLAQRAHPPGPALPSAAWPLIRARAGPPRWRSGTGWCRWTGSRRRGTGSLWRGGIGPSLWHGRIGGRGAGRRRWPSARHRRLPSGQRSWWL